ncbi:hypothetical protein CRUP_013169 [Coryphaenoides rupestris]|nr:hypothetical protein CRUP_013169 [Coryphaenoides rupestris]
MPPSCGSCPDCGSSRVLQVEVYCESQWVCQDCGSVVSAGRLVSDPGPGLGPGSGSGPGTTDVRYRHTTPGRSQIRGLQRVRAMCRILRLSYEVEELAEVFFRKAYIHGRFLRVRLEKKEALVGCCVLVSCRLRNWPLALGTICSLLEADPLLVGGVYKDLDKILDMDIPKTCITDVLEAHSREYKVSSVHVPEELAESAAALARRSVALVELAADSWIVTGRHPVPIMMAAIFLSWQSLNPTRVRLKYSLNKFCQLSKMPLNKTAGKRVREMTDVLCKLGQEIPWLRAEELVSPAQMLQHLEDILQHRYALLRHALQTHQDTLETDQDTSETDQDTLETHQDTGVQPGSNHPPLEALCQAPDQVERPPSELTKVNRDQHEAGGASHGNSEQQPVANWGKRMLFAPPCVRNPKIRKVAPSEQADVNGDEDISDSEIQSYLRTPQEVREYVQMQQSLLSGSEDKGQSKRE